VDRCGLGEFAGAQHLAGIPLTVAEVAVLVASWVVLGTIALALTIRARGSLDDPSVPGA